MVYYNHQLKYGNWFEFFIIYFFYFQSLNLSEISNDETTRNHRSYDLKSRVANTEIQLKYLACAHIDLKNELSVLHQMVTTKFFCSSFGF